MASKEVRFSVDDIERDDSPEIFMEIWEAGDVESELSVTFSAYVSSSNKDGIYDTVGARMDLDGNGKVNKKDDKRLLKLAQKVVMLLK